MAVAVIGRRHAPSCIGANPRPRLCGSVYFGCHTTVLLYPAERAILAADLITAASCRLSFRVPKYVPNCANLRSPRDMF